MTAPEMSRGLTRHRPAGPADEAVDLLGGSGCAATSRPIRPAGVVDPADDVQAAGASGRCNRCSRREWLPVGTDLRAAQRDRARSISIAIPRRSSRRVAAFNGRDADASGPAVAAPLPGGPATASTPGRRDRRAVSTARSPRSLPHPGPATHRQSGAWPAGSDDLSDAEPLLQLPGEAVQTDRPSALWGGGTRTITLGQRAEITRKGQQGGIDEPHLLLSSNWPLMHAGLSRTSTVTSSSPTDVRHARPNPLDLRGDRIPELSETTRPDLI